MCARYRVFICTLFVRPRVKSVRGDRRTTTIAMVHKYCQNCAKPVKYLCDCCHQVGYCCVECQKTDWNTLHRHEQLVMTVTHHASLQSRPLSLDASRTKKPRHRDAYTRPIRGPSKRETPSREAVEQEIKRRVKRGLPSLTTTTTTEQMEVIVNTMPATLQRAKDTQLDVMELREQTIAAMMGAVESRHGFAAEPHHKPTEERLRQMEAQRRVVFRDPDELKREEAREYMHTLAQSARIMDARWAELGEARRTVITEPHKTAIAHYLRMVEVCRLKAGLARYTRQPQHVQEAVDYRLQVDEFNQLLTHDLFFDGLVDYDTVTLSMDAARYDEMGKQEAVYMYDEAITAAAETLRLLAENPGSEPVYFGGNPFASAGVDDDDETRRNLLQSVRIMVDQYFTGDGLKGRVGNMVRRLAANVTGYVHAEYDHLQRQSKLDPRFVRNSKQLVSSISDQMCDLVEADTVDEEPRGLLQRLRDKLSQGYGTVRDWVTGNVGHALAVFATTVATSLLVYTLGTYTNTWRVDVSLDTVVKKLADIKESLVTQIAGPTSDNIKLLNDTSTDMASIISEKEALAQRILLPVTNINDVDISAGNVALNTELAMYERAISTHMENIAKSGSTYLTEGYTGEMFAKLRSRFQSNLQQYPVLVDSEERRSLLAEIHRYLLNSQGDALALGLAGKVEDYLEQLRRVKVVLDTTIDSQGKLLNALTELESEAGKLVEFVGEVRTRVQETENKAPFATAMLGRIGLCVDTSRLTHLTSAWGSLLSFAYTVTGVTAAGLWLMQCDARTNALVDMWAQNWSVEWGDPSTWWDLVSNLFRTACDPSCSAFITIYYMMHAGYTLGTNAWVQWAGSLFGAFKPLGRAAGWLWQKMTRSNQAEEEEELEADGGGGGPADPLTEYENPLMLVKVKRVVDGYFRFKWGPDRMLQELAMKLDKGKILATEYGLSVSYLRDRLLALQLDEWVVQMPSVRQPLRPNDDPTHMAFNAHQYTAAYVLRRDGGGGGGGGFSLPTRVTDTVRGVYKLTGKFALIHQFNQFWLFAKGVCDLATSIVAAPLLGSGTLASLIGAALTMGAPMAAIAAFRSDVIWRHTPLRVLIPVGGAALYLLSNNGVLLPMMLNALLWICPLWFTGTQILSSTLVKSYYAATTGTLPVDNPAALHDLAMQQATEQLIKYDLVTATAGQVLPLSDTAKTLINGILNTTMAARAGAPKDTALLLDILGKYQETSRLLAENVNKLPGLVTQG